MGRCGVSLACFYLDEVEGSSLYLQKLKALVIRLMAVSPACCDAQVWAWIGGFGGVITLEVNPVDAFKMLRRIASCFLALTFCS